MRRGFGVGMVLVATLLAIGVGVGAYNWGFSEGLESARAGGEVVRVIGPGFGGFPFGLILLILLGFFILRGLFWGRRWAGHGHGPGGWGPGHWAKRDEIAEEWHRRLHEQGPEERPPGDRASV
jgi:hypothetical protein